MLILGGGGIGYRTSILMNMQQHMGDAIGQEANGSSSRRSSAMPGESMGATVEAELSQELMETQVGTALSCIF